MRINVIMPDLSTASSTVKVLEWLVKPGQEIKRGQPLMDVETDKATTQVEAYINGTILEIVALPEMDVEVGQIIAVMETDEEGPGPAPQAAAGQAPAKAQPEVKPVQAADEARPKGMFNRNRQKARE